LFGLSESRTTDWAQTEANLQQEAKTAETERHRNIRSLEAYGAVALMFSSMRNEIARRIEIFENLAAALERDGAVDHPVSANGSAGGNGLFELATEVGWEEHHVMEGERVERISFLRSRPGAIGAGPALDDERAVVAELARLGYFQPVIAGRVLKLLGWPSGAISNLRQLFNNVFSQHVEERHEERLGFRMVEYLDWVYRYARHANGPSQGSPIDPVLMLRHRCDAPFLEVDEALLGFEGLASTEDIALYGVDQTPAQDPLSSRCLIDLEAFDAVATGAPARLDLSFSRHGYPFAALKSLREFKVAYDHLLNTLHEPVHIHRDWPGTIMDGLVP
jgi:hypothetical protein